MYHGWSLVLIIISSLRRVPKQEPCRIVFCSFGFRLLNWSFWLTRSPTKIPTNLVSLFYRYVVNSVGCRTKTVCTGEAKKGGSWLNRHSLNLSFELWQSFVHFNPLSFLQCNDLRLVTLLDKTDYFDEIMFEILQFITTACTFDFMNKTENLGKQHKFQRWVNSVVHYTVLTSTVFQ